MSKFEQEISALLSKISEADFSDGFLLLLREISIEINNAVNQSDFNTPLGVLFDDCYEFITTINPFLLSKLDETKLTSISDDEELIINRKLVKKLATRPAWLQEIKDKFNTTIAQVKQSKTSSSSSTITALNTMETNIDPSFSMGETEDGNSSPSSSNDSIAVQQNIEANVEQSQLSTLSSLSSTPTLEITNTIVTHSDSFSSAAMDMTEDKNSNASSSSIAVQQNMLHTEIEDVKSGPITNINSLSSMPISSSSSSYATIKGKVNQYEEKVLGWESISEVKELFRRVYDLTNELNNEYIMLAMRSGYDAARQRGFLLSACFGLISRLESVIAIEFDKKSLNEMINDYSTRSKKVNKKSSVAESEWVQNVKSQLKKLECRLTQSTTAMLNSSFSMDETKNEATYSPLDHNTMSLSSSVASSSSSSVGSHFDEDSDISNNFDDETVTKDKDEDDDISDNFDDEVTKDKDEDSDISDNSDDEKAAKAKSLNDKKTEAKEMWSNIMSPETKKQIGKILKTHKIVGKLGEDLIVAIQEGDSKEQFYLPLVNINRILKYANVYDPVQNNVAKKETSLIKKYIRTNENSKPQQCVKLTNALISVLKFARIIKYKLITQTLYEQRIEARTLLLGFLSTVKTNFPQQCAEPASSSNSFNKAPKNKTQKAIENRGEQKTNKENARLIKLCEEKENEQFENLLQDNGCIINDQKLVFYCAVKNPKLHFLKASNLISFLKDSKVTQKAERLVFQFSNELLPGFINHAWYYFVNKELINELRKAVGQIHSQVPIQSKRCTKLALSLENWFELGKLEEVAKLPFEFSSEKLVNSQSNKTPKVSIFKNLELDLEKAGYEGGLPLVIFKEKNSSEYLISIRQFMAFRDDKKLSSGGQIQRFTQFIENNVSNKKFVAPIKMLNGITAQPTAFISATCLLYALTDSKISGNIIYKQENESRVNMLVNVLTNAIAPSSSESKRTDVNIGKKSVKIGSDAKASISSQSSTANKSTVSGRNSSSSSSSSSSTIATKKQGKAQLEAASSTNQSLSSDLSKEDKQTIGIKRARTDKAQKSNITKVGKNGAKDDVKASMLSQSSTANKSTASRHNSSSSSSSSSTTLAAKKQGKALPGTASLIGNFSSISSNKRSVIGDTVNNSSSSTKTLNNSLASVK